MADRPAPRCAAMSLSGSPSSRPRRAGASFVVRVWHEPPADEVAPGPSRPEGGLRGSIEFVGRPVRRYFISLEGLTQIIADALGAGEGRQS